MSQNPPPIPTNHHHLKKQTATTLPDFVLTALSLFLLVSSSSKPLSLAHHHPRRNFLKISTMSHPNPNPSRRRFATPQSLSDWLKPRLPSDSFASWGVKPGTKNVHSLFLELSEGETTLVNDDDDAGPPVRALDVVTVRIIGSSSRILIESRQELSDGTVRDRNRPLSEKMKPGETLEAAVVRAVREELGSVIGDVDGVVRIVPDSYVKKVEERVSLSYPGLPARYVLHSVDAVVDGLPDGEFCTEEREEYEDTGKNTVAGAAISCKKHYWKWVDANAV